MASLELRRVGLGVGVTALLPDDQAVEGIVLAQDPPGKAQGIDRPTINLLVATTNDELPDGFVMPDLTGMTVGTAQAELTKVGIKSAPPKFVDTPIASVGTGDELPKPPTRLGVVIAQLPVAGFRVDQSTLVKLTVSR